MGEDLQLHLAPGQEDVGMMSLLFGQGSDPVDEVQGRQEIGQGPGLPQMMVITRWPSWFGTFPPVCFTGL